jgi:calcium-dependent protein kinase
MAEQLYNLSAQELNELRQEFAAMDANGDGFISVDEFAKALGNKDIGAVQLLVDSLDVNKDGKLDFTELLNMVIKHKSSGDDAKKLAFEMYDTNHDGSISRDELFYAVKTLLGSEGEALTKQQINQAFDHFDTNKDNTLSFEEFCGILEQIGEQ